jgi:hypothetical protein
MTKPWTLHIFDGQIYKQAEFIRCQKSLHTNLRICGLNLLPKILLKQFVGCQVANIGVAIIQVHVSQTKVFANFRNRRRLFFRRNFDSDWS